MNITATFNIENITDKMAYKNVIVTKNDVDPYKRFDKIIKELGDIAIKSLNINKEFKSNVHYNVTNLSIG